MSVRSGVLGGSAAPNGVVGDVVVGAQGPPGSTRGSVKTAVSGGGDVSPKQALQVDLRCFERELNRGKVRSLVLRWADGLAKKPTKGDIGVLEKGFDEAFEVLQEMWCATKEKVLEKHLDGYDEVVKMDGQMQWACDEAGVGDLLELVRKAQDGERAQRELSELRLEVLKLKSDRAKSHAGSHVSLESPKGERRGVMVERQGADTGVMGARSADLVRQEGMVYGSQGNIGRVPHGEGYGREYDDRLVSERLDYGMPGRGMSRHDQSGYGRSGEVGSHGGYLGYGSAQRRDAMMQNDRAMSYGNGDGGMESRRVNQGYGSERDGMDQGMRRPYGGVEDYGRSGRVEHLGYGTHHDDADYGLRGRHEAGNNCADMLGKYRNDANGAVESRRVYQGYGARRDDADHGLRDRRAAVNSWADKLDKYKAYRRDDCDEESGDGSLPTSAGSLDRRQRSRQREWESPEREYGTDRDERRVRIDERSPGRDQVQQRSTRVEDARSGNADNAERGPRNEGSVTSQQMRDFEERIKMTMQLTMQSTMLECEKARMNSAMMSQLPPVEPFTGQGEQKFADFVRSFKMKFGRLEICDENKRDLFVGYLKGEGRRLYDGLSLDAKSSMDYMQIVAAMEAKMNGKSKLDKIREKQDWINLRLDGRDVAEFCCVLEDLSGRLFEGSPPKVLDQMRAFSLLEALKEWPEHSQLTKEYCDAPEGCMYNRVREFAINVEFSNNHYVRTAGVVKDRWSNHGVNHAMNGGQKWGYGGLKDHEDQKCYNCGGYGHKSNVCTSERLPWKDNPAERRGREPPRLRDAKGQSAVHVVRDDVRQDGQFDNG